MRIVTNPGSNLDEDMTLAQDIDLTPQKIVVDGISHDTRNTIDFAQVDGWVKRAHKYPQVQGTTEQDFVEYFSRLVKKDPEVLCVMTSRKLIGSHDAALAAVAKLKASSDPELKAARIEVVDSQVTDVGAGLCTLAAAQARKAGLNLRGVAQFLRSFAERNRNVLTVATLENLIKGGRASFLQGWVGNFLDIRPMISINAGVVSTVAKLSGKADVVQKIDDYVSSRLDPKTAVWLAVAHGNAPEKAKAVAARLQERYRCEYTLVRPLSPSIYLHMGPGSVMAFLFPLDGLGFRPTPP
ncbi:MAG: DegV family protein [Archangium sp.]|nr:DegV family protein [Archangium sp.]MDP3153903.1 DegV family protein [Archangium sp.]MDP3575089.1 DegV family protein [Archangium sp.]